MFKSLIDELRILCSEKVEKNRDCIDKVHNILCNLDFDYNTFIKECNNVDFTIGMCTEFFALDLKTEVYRKVSRFLFPVAVFDNQELDWNMNWNKELFKWDDAEPVSDYLRRKA